MERIDGTNYRAGVIKVAVSYFNIHLAEEKCLKAAAKAYKETGAPIQVHTTYGTMGLEITTILKKEEVDLGKVLLLHMDENLDLCLHTTRTRKSIKKTASISLLINSEGLNIE